MTVDEYRKRYLEIQDIKKKLEEERLKDSPVQPGDIIQEKEYDVYSRQFELMPYKYKVKKLSVNSSGDIFITDVWAKKRDGSFGKQSMSIKFKVNTDKPNFVKIDE